MARLSLEGALVEKQDGDLDAGDGSNVEELDHVCNLRIVSSVFGTLNDIAEGHHKGNLLTDASTGEETYLSP
jgi:hypothetical protein